MKIQEKKEMFHEEKGIFIGVNSGNGEVKFDPFIKLSNKNSNMIILGKAGMGKGFKVKPEYPK